MDENGIYIKIGSIIAPILFIGIWIYALVTLGFLLGLAVGWIPAFMGAFIARYIWPLIILGILVVVLIVFAL